MPIRLGDPCFGSENGNLILDGRETNGSLPGVDELGARYRRLLDMIGEVCVRAGRSPDEVTILPVTKTHGPDLIRLAFKAGMTAFGENRVQEALVKIEELRDIDACWHLIGHLQSNKAGKAARAFDSIQSLDRLKLASAVDRHAADAGRKLPVHIQVNVSGEDTKFGVAPDSFEELRDAVAALPNLDFRGLMTVGLFSSDESAVRKGFALLRKLRDDSAAKGFFNGGGELSMGMTSDFEAAILEGATMIRIGTAIFGYRRS